MPTLHWLSGLYLDQRWQMLERYLLSHCHGISGSTAEVLLNGLIGLCLVSCLWDNTTLKASASESVISPTSYSSLNTFVSRLLKPLLSYWFPGPVAHQALVQYHVGWLSYGGQMPSLWPGPQRGGGASLLPGTVKKMFIYRSWKPALCGYKKVIYEI